MLYVVFCLIMLSYSVINDFLVFEMIQPSLYKESVLNFYLAYIKWNDFIFGLLNHFLHFRAAIPYLPIIEYFTILIVQ